MYRKSATTIGPLREKLFLSAGAYAVVDDDLDLPDIVPHTTEVGGTCPRNGGFRSGELASNLWEAC